MTNLLALMMSVTMTPGFQESKEVSHSVTATLERDGTVFLPRNRDVLVSM